MMTEVKEAFRDCLLALLLGNIDVNNIVTCASSAACEKEAANAADD